MSVRLKSSCGVKGLVLPLVAALVLVSCVSMTHGQQVIVAEEVEWSYLSPEGAADDPGDFDPSFDSTWFTTGYDDADWFSDEGPLMYGTINGFGNRGLPALLDPGSGDRYTNYFRYAFNTNRTYNDLAVDILADDGAVIYLDGQEVLRFNCCDTPEDDFLSFSNGTGNEDAYRVVGLPDVGQLAAGDHLLAVSVHQTSVTSSDIGLGLNLLADVEPPPPPPTPLELPENTVSITSGVDTTLADGLNGPDGTHGAAGSNSEGERWEWDGSDGGGSNDGLIWFDIPDDVLTEFAKLGDQGAAAIRLYVDNNGNAGSMYRMTDDWLSGPNGGDEVTKNNIPGGPGVVPGDNAELNANYIFPESLGGLQDTVVQVDVSGDVQAWASGAPNYGWGIIGAGTDGTGITSFENTSDPIPELLIGVETVAGAELEAGDADQDLDFDQFDLIKVQVAGKYLTGQAATWGDGDWNAAPGGSVGSPPQGDGFFNQLDIIAASLGGKYLTGPYGAIAPGGEEADGQTSIIYNAGTGEVAVDAPAGVELTSVNIDSAGGIFTGDAATNLGGSFDNDADNNIFKATFGSSFASLSFGNVAQAGLSEEFVAGDLTVVGSLAGGGDLGAVDLIYVPEPSTMLLLALGLLGVVANRRRRR